MDRVFNIMFGRLSFTPGLKNVPDKMERILGGIVDSSEYLSRVFFWDLAHGWLS